MPEPAPAPTATTCVLCGTVFDGWGHNPAPLASLPAKCCSDCNQFRVIPARLGRIREAR
jgi:hypothetical protein